VKLANATTTLCFDRKDVLAPIHMGDEQRIELALEFTKIYQEHGDKPVAVREALCQRAVLPKMCRDVPDDHLFAGGMFYNFLVGVGLEYCANAKMDALTADDSPRSSRSPEMQKQRNTLGFSNSGFCFHFEALDTIADGMEPGSSKRQGLREMIDFWLRESTRYKYNQALPKRITDGLGTSDAFDVRFAVGYPRLATFSVDYDLLLRNGLPGLEGRIAESRLGAEEAGSSDKVAVYEAMQISLDTIRELCAVYVAKIGSALAGLVLVERREELARMRESLQAIQVRKPESLHEAIQLYWIYFIATFTKNLGRMDIYFGDFYAADIDAGRESVASAQRLINNLWQMIADLRYLGLGTGPNGRVFIGGRGRRNEANADRFSLAAMEASRLVRATEPNLTLRFYQGQDPALMAKAITVIGEGTIHPGLYNDDVHIPMVMDAFGVDESEAAKYIPQGCGELNMDGCTVGSPNSILNLMHGLELVLHNGWNHVIGEQRGLAQGSPETFTTFESLLEAYFRQVDAVYDILAQRHAIEHEVMAKETGFVMLSILTHDCIGKGETLYTGARYKGGIIETFGMTNVADGLHAIRELVYRRKVFSLAELVAMLDADFDGCEDARQMMLSLPKYGNDNPEVDALHRQIVNTLNESAWSKAAKWGLDFFLNCNLNPGGAIYADNTGASADGRRAGVAFALGNCPTAGMDTSGITALLNSMARPVRKHAGFVHNLKVSRDLFSAENRAKLESLISTYFSRGGMQLMVTALNRDDLENAMREPEKYRNLMVRVAGWTGRFVEQSAYLQKEILNRTFYA